MAAPGRVLGAAPAKTHFEASDWAILVTAEEDRKRNLLTRRITSFRRAGSRYWRSEEVHYQKLVGKPVVMRLLREAGFRVRSLPGYGELRFPRGLVGYLGSKATPGR
jgi:hypothetical protein